jgi:hypothetical protein
MGSGVFQWSWFELGDAKLTPFVEDDPFWVVCRALIQLIWYDTLIYEVLMGTDEYGTACLLLDAALHLQI